MKLDKYVSSNRAIWDSWSEHQSRSTFYDIDGFKAGSSHLRPYEIDEVGPVTGKDLLHLQCRFGTETLSWARLGAKVTGVDFSDTAIQVARQLAGDLGIPARFVTSDIYALSNTIADTFDIIYTSRGVIGWLPELDGWAKTITRHLRPGGFFYITEIHPVARVFANEPGVTGLVPRYDYFGREQPLVFSASRHTSYASEAGNSETPEDESVYCWTHTLGDLVTALARSGLHIDFIREFPFCDWELSFTRQVAENEWYARAEVAVDIPLFFSLRASKP